MARSQLELSGGGIEDFYFLASTRDQQSSRRQLHGLIRKLEMAVIHRRSWCELSAVRVVDFSAVQVAVPAVRVGATSDQHSAIGKKPSSVLATGVTQAAGLSESAGFWQQGAAVNVPWNAPER